MNLLIRKIIMRILGPYAYPGVSIVDDVIRYFDLSGNEEFRVRYFVSRIGFDERWARLTRTTEDAVESFYNEHDADLWRQAYLSQFSHTYKHKILSAFDVTRTYARPKDRVLEYGCGAGVLGRYLAKHGFSVDVADIRSKTLDFVRAQLAANFANVFEVNRNFELPHHTYAAIHCLDVLEHTLHPLEIARRLVDCLRQGGLLHISFPVEHDFSGAHTREAQQERPAVFQMLREYCEEIEPEKIYSKTKNENLHSYA